MKPRQLSMVLGEAAWAELQRLVAERRRDHPHLRKRNTPGRVARELLEAELEQLAALRQDDVATRREATRLRTDPEAQP